MISSLNFKEFSEPALAILSTCSDLHLGKNNSDPSLSNLGNLADFSQDWMDEINIDDSQNYGRRIFRSLYLLVQKAQEI